MNDVPPAAPVPVHRLLGGSGLALAFLAAGLLLIVGREAGGQEGAAPLQAAAAALVGGLGVSAIALMRVDSTRLLWAARVLALGVAIPAGSAGLLLRAAAEPSPITPLLFLLSVSALSWIGASFVLSRHRGPDAGQTP